MISKKTLAAYYHPHNTDEWVLVDVPPLQFLMIDEAPKLRALHYDYMPVHGYAFAGRHHEIYLSDMHKVEPSRLRTILRQPLRST